VSFFIYLGVHCPATCWAGLLGILLGLVMGFFLP